MNSLTSYSETYILEKICYIEKKLKFSIKSTIEFKQFLKQSNNFDSEKYLVMGWDVSDLNTNIDVDLTIELIIKFIFNKQNTQNVFPENPENPKMRPENLREFLKCLLQK